MTKITDPGGRTKERRMKPGKYNRTRRGHGRRVEMRTAIEQALSGYHETTPRWLIKYHLSDKMVAIYGADIGEINHMIEQTWRAQR